MINKEHISSIANEHLKGSSLYLTGIRVSPDNHISLFIDGDEGVKISDCIALSRAVEGQLDRTKEDFALDVSSHGAAAPIASPRQYKRHVGREFELRLNDGGKASGKLVAYTEQGIEIEYSTRENKPVGKGKVDVVHRQSIDHDQIKEAKIKLKF